MTAAQKRDLLYRPLLEELKPFGFFKKGDALWKVDRTAGYLVSFQAHVISAGFFNYVTLRWGSFYHDLMLDAKGADLGNVTKMQLAPQMPPDNVFSNEWLDTCCQDYAARLLACMREHHLPLFKQSGHDLQSYLTMSEGLRNLPEIKLFKTFTAKEEALAYLAAGQKEQALRFLDESSDAQPDLSQQFLSGAVHDPALPARLKAMDDEEVKVFLDSRRARAEEQCLAFFGPKQFK